MAKLIRQISRLEMVRAQTSSYSYSTIVQVRSPNQHNASRKSSDEDRSDCLIMSQYSKKDAKSYTVENVPRKDKINILVNTLLDLKDNKEAVYGALDAWVAWERNFPIGPIKRAILTLEKEQQWHKIVQVIKWMLSKGQGTTMGTYGQLIRALDMDNRAGEAHEIWVKKVGRDLHSVPWQLCKLMISVYHRNDMLEDLVKLFKGMEAFDRKPREKSILRKVTDSYEMLGLPEEKDKVLEKYKNLFTETWKGHLKQSRRIPSKKK